MNFLVIGHTVSDIINESGGQRAQPGGIYYTISALIAIKENLDKIYLVSSIDDKNRHLFRKLYSGIESRYIKTVDEIPVVNLKIVEKKEREECYLNVTDKVDLTELLRSDIEIDGILINMITGTEIDSEDLMQLRKKFDIPIYFDLHTLSRGIDSSMRRYFRVVPDIESWLENIDILQMNENEMRSLGMGEEEFSIAERVFNYRPSVIIITKGVKGSRIFMKTEHDFFSYYEPAVEVNSVNNVGCGDVFGAAFFYDYIKTGNVLESFRTANRYGAVSTTYKNINDLINIKNDIDKFADQ